MFYLFSILGVNEGENTVLRTEKKKIPGSGLWTGLWGLALEECLSRTSQARSAPLWTHPLGRESYDPSSLGTSAFVYPQTLDHGGNGKEDW